MGNVSSGVGYRRDEALRNAGRGRVRSNSRTLNLGIGHEREMLFLDVENFDHVDFVRGDLASIGKQGKIVPLNNELPFAGVVDSIGEDRGGYVAAVFTRAALVVRVHGLSSQTRQGAPVYAVPGLRTQTFTLEETGVAVGEILAIENLERSTAIVGVRRAGDARPFELAGPRPSRLGGLR